MGALLRSALISISMDTLGLFSLSLRSGAKSAIGFPLRCKFVRAVKFSRGETSLMLLPLKPPTA